MTRFTAWLAAGMHRTEHRVRKRRVPRCSAPLAPVSPAPGSKPPSAPQPAFALPDGTGNSDQPFPRLQQRRLSTPPFQGQQSWPTPSLPHLQASSPVRPPAPPPLPVRPGRGGFLASGPLRLRPRAPRTASTASAPLSGFYPRRDRSVQPFPPPFGPPSESARSPIAPRSPRSFRIGAADHRSRSATFPEACCSSNLLEPSLICGKSRFSSIANVPVSGVFPQ